MKNLYLIAFLALVSFASCKKSDNTSPYSKLKVSFSNEVDGQEIEMSKLKYKNAKGNSYNVDLLKYYVTHFNLVKADGTEVPFSNYHLVDAFNPASLSFTLDSVLNGDYTSINFLLGVDSAHNHTLAQEGALDPSHGMIWDWNTGYIFFKHEGNFIDKNGNTKSLVFHYGTDMALSKISVNIPKMSLNGSSKNLQLKFNLNKAYTSPGDIDFDEDNFHMSSSADDIFWIFAMKKNFADAFSFGSVE